MFFVRAKRVEELEREINNLKQTIGELKYTTDMLEKSKKEIKCTINMLNKCIDAQRERIDDLSKRTVSQMTTEKDRQMMPGEILDEWLNGAKDGDGNG